MPYCLYHYYVNMKKSQTSDHIHFKTPAPKNKRVIMFSDIINMSHPVYCISIADATIFNKSWRTHPKVGFIQHRVGGWGGEKAIWHKLRLICTSFKCLHKLNIHFFGQVPSGTGLWLKGKMQSFETVAGY